MPSTPTDDDATAGPGRKPETIVACLSCGAVYPAREIDGEIHPIGMGGECTCGGDAFEEVEPAT